MPLDAWALGPGDLFSRPFSPEGGTGVATGYRGIKHLLLILALSAILIALTTASASAIGVGCGGVCKDGPASTRSSGGRD